MPAYDPALSYYAPGSVLALELARAMAGEGVVEMDLGPGGSVWKREFANAEVPLMRGVAHAASRQGRLNAAAFSAGRRWAGLPLGPAAALPHRVSRRLERELGRFAPRPAGGARAGPPGGRATRRPDGSRGRYARSPFRHRNQPLARRVQGSLLQWSGVMSVVFRVAPLGPNWVIRAADDHVLHGYPTREQACRAAELAAQTLRAQGEAVELLVDGTPGPAA